MTNDKFLKLTNAVYKVLEFFPESDPLKNRAKDKALAIMEHLVLINETSGWASFQKDKIKAHILEDIDVLSGYLWIGKSQGWLNSVNCLIISNEYEKIKKEIEPMPLMEFTKKPDKSPEGHFDPLRQSSSEASRPVTIPPKADLVGLPDRQSKILEFLSKNEKAQVMDLQTVLPDVTKRTIRRDLDELLEAGKITRLGDFNEIFYKLA